MTSFELLEYVVTFLICLGLVLVIVEVVYMYFSHKKSFNEFLQRREKMGESLNANSSGKEK